MRQYVVSRRGRYAISIGGVLLLTGLLLMVPTVLEQTDVALLYLVVVLLSATFGGLGPGIVGSLLAFLAANFFFVSPRYTFMIANSRDLLRLAVFLVVAITTSTLAGRLQQQARVAHTRTQQLTTLYTLSQTISADVDLDRILPVIAHATVRLLDVPCCHVLLADSQGVMVERAQSGRAPDPARRIDTVLRAGARTLGVLRVLDTPASAPLPPLAHEQLHLLAAQIVLLLDRAQLAQQTNAAQTLAESDRLKSVLLTSVSHDFRTPLAVVKGAVTNLLDETVGWDIVTQRELLTIINIETDRLNRLVRNLLDMARIEAHVLPSSRAWQDVGEVVQLVAARIQPLIASHPLQIDIAPDLPLIPLNVSQIDQILTNLLENAAVHTSPTTPIAISAHHVGANIQIAVRDWGPGIPPELCEHIFERFVRVIGPERHATGSGLGLAIARGLAEAHKGWLTVANCADGGVRFVLTLPSPPAVNAAPTSALLAEEAA